MHSKFFNSFIILLFAVFIQAAHSQQLKKFDELPKKSSISLIQDDLNNSKITKDESALNIGLALADWYKLPTKYKSIGFEKCGTWALEEIRREWKKLSSNTKNKLLESGFSSEGFLLRPTFLTSTRSTQHFKVHFSLTSGDSNAVNPTDSDNNGTPDYIDKVLFELENVWRGVIDSMGYSSPPPDSLLGGDNKYDVYIFKLSPGLYGYVQPEVKIGDNPNSPKVELNARYSYMALRNNYDGFQNPELQNIQVTIAHEFFHSIQVGYDSEEMPWMKEATATWIEDEIYNDINDNYQYLRDWFSNPWIPLDATKSEVYNHWYGSWIFFRYISEQVGVNVIRIIWEKSIDHNSELGDFSFSAINDGLAMVGSNYNVIFKNFLAANLIKESISNLYNYREGSNYPDIMRDFILYGKKEVNSGIYRRASRYIKIAKNFGDTGSDVATITFTPLDAGADFSVTFVGKSGMNVDVEHFFPGLNSYVIVNTNSYDEITIIVAALSPAGFYNNFNLKIQSPTKIIKLADDVLGRLEVSNLGYGWLTRNPKRDLFLQMSGRAHQSSKVISFSLSDDKNNAVFTKKDPLSYYGLNYILYAFRDNSSFPLIKSPDDNTGSDLPPMLISTTHVKPVTAGNYAWFSGTKGNSYPYEPGLWRLNINDGSYTKIADYSLSYGDKLIADSTKAVWLYDDAIYEGKKLILHKQGTNSTIVSHHSTDQYHFYNDPEFHDSIIVWIDVWVQTSQNITCKLRAYNIYTNTFIEIDSAQSSKSAVNIDVFKTYSNRVIYRKINDNTRYQEVYLWYNGLKNKIFEALPSHELNITLRYPFFAINKEGAAWVLAGQNIYGEKTIVFYFLDFLSGITTDVTISGNSNLQYAEEFGLMKRDFIFTALDYNLSTPKAGIYTFTIDDFITGLYYEPDKINLAYSLEQNYPNPFNPTTTIHFSLPQSAHVILKVFDVLGREVATLVDSELNAGEHSVQFNAERLSSGVYFYQLISGKYIQTKKMLISK